MSILKDCNLLYFFSGLILYLVLRCWNLKNEISTQKEYFIKTLGHDLRVAVIAQIRGLDLLKKTNLYCGSHVLLNEIYDGCKYTLEMITMLMKIYKIENMDMKLDYKNVNISQIIKDIFSEYSDLAADKNIILNCEIGNEIIYADADSIFKVLRMLILTSIQYSKCNTHLNLVVENLFNKSVIKISYVGDHISDEEYRRMFSKDSSFSTVGHGIQMYLCKQIIDLHKGKIKFKSTSKINLFEIQLPKPFYRKSFDTHSLFLIKHHV